jgi:hypothetical protein
MPILGKFWEKFLTLCRSLAITRTTPKPTLDKGNSSLFVDPIWRYLKQFAFRHGSRNHQYEEIFVFGLGVVGGNENRQMVN